MLRFICLFTLQLPYSDLAQDMSKASEYDQEMPQPHTTQWCNSVRLKWVIFVVHTPKSVIEPNMNTLSQNVKEEFALRARNNWWLDGRTGQITIYPTFPTKMYLSHYH